MIKTNSNNIYIIIHILIRVKSLSGESHCRKNGLNSGQIRIASGPQRDNFIRGSSTVLDNLGFDHIRVNRSAKITLVVRETGIVFPVIRVRNRRGTDILDVGLLGTNFGGELQFQH